MTQAGRVAGWPAGKAYLQEGCEESTFGKGRGCSLQSCCSLAAYPGTHCTWVNSPSCLEES